MQQRLAEANIEKRPIITDPKEINHPVIELQLYVKYGNRHKGNHAEPPEYTFSQDGDEIECEVVVVKKNIRYAQKGKSHFLKVAKYLAALALLR